MEHRQQHPTDELLARSPQEVLACDDIEGYNRYILVLLIAYDARHNQSGQSLSSLFLILLHTCLPVLLFFCSAGNFASTITLEEVRTATTDCCTSSYVAILCGIRTRARGHAPDARVFLHLRASAPSHQTVQVFYGGVVYCWPTSASWLRYNCRRCATRSGLCCCCCCGCGFAVALWWRGNKNAANSLPTVRPLLYSPPNALYLFQRVLSPKHRYSTFYGRMHSCTLEMSSY